MGTAACGRFGFDHTPPSADTDAAPTADAPTVAPTGFVCNTPQRFATTGAPVAAMASIATTTGHVVAIVDDGGNLSASSFKNDVDTLTPLSANIVIDTGVTSTITVAASGDNVVVSGLYGSPMPTGTKLYPRDASGAARGSAADHVELGTDRALSASDTGQLAFATIDATTGNLEMRKVDVSGNYVGAASVIVDGATRSPSYAVLQPGPGGYTLEWRDSTGYNLAVLNNSLAVVAGPVQLTNSTGFTQIRPKIAYSAATHTYGITWHEKNATNDDDVWFQVRAADLSAVTIPVMLDTFAANPEVIDNDTGFWVSWMNYNGKGISAAHVSSAGVVATRTVMTSGGMASKWSLLRSGAQPVLVWVETGGTGPDMWIDPMCE